MVIAAVLTSSVYPLGVAFATRSVPITVPAPGRLSATTGWPHFSPSRAPSSRAMMSPPPPGAYGTTMRTGDAGKSSASGAACEDAVTVASISAADEFIISFHGVPKCAAPRIRCINSRHSGHDPASSKQLYGAWIPACAGMTTWRVVHLAFVSGLQFALE